ncbi:MAG: xanthine dehydrogenase family protein molybdopterin-binding subunit, partial [Proteobacteria bacterium]
VNTSMAQLIAEELECDWTKIRSVSSGVSPVYNHTQFGAIQMTGGSTALNSSWDQHLLLGAQMREMLKSAAATRWGVKVSEVKASKGMVTHPKKGSLTYGELAEEANKLPLPEKPPMKDPKDYKIIGQSLKRVDAPAKTNGTAIFGIDVKVPGMIYAVVARPPLAGSKLKSMKESDAKKVRGVIDVVKFEDRVAVLAKNTYAAIKGREVLNAQWDVSANKDISDTSLMTSFKEKAKTTGLVAEKRGDAAAALSKAKSKAIYEYEFPFLAHAPMEPLNCTITFDGKKAEAWSGFQMPTTDRAAIAQVLGLKPVRGRKFRKTCRKKF